MSVQNGLGRSAQLSGRAERALPSDNTFFPDQVKAMEQRAKQVGKGGELYYINPANGDYFTKNLTEGARAEALGMADHLLEDFHVTVIPALLS